MSFPYPVNHVGEALERLKAYQQADGGYNVTQLLLDLVAIMKAAEQPKREVLEQFEQMWRDTEIGKGH